MPRVGKRPEDRRRQANLPTDQPRKRVHIKLSEAEHERVRERAEREGISIPRLYVREAFNSNTVMRARLRASIDKLMATEHPLAREVAGPINDLAHWANIHHEAPANVAEVLAKVEPALSVLDEAVDEYREVLIGITQAGQYRPW